MDTASVRISDYAADFKFDFRRHYVMLAAFAFSLLVIALIFLFVHTIILED